MNENDQRDQNNLLRRFVAEAEKKPIDEISDADIEVFFRKCARMATRQFDKKLQTYIEDNAMGIIAVALFDPKRAGYDPQRAAENPQRTTFRAWCKCVLKNAALDELERRRRESCYLADVENTAAEPTSGLKHEECLEHREKIAVWSRRFCEILDGLAWSSTNRKVDYFAVLLMYLRLRFAAAAACNGFAPLIVEGWLSWDAEKEARSLHAGWPTLGALWAELAPKLDKPPYVQLLCDTIGQLAAESNAEWRLTPATWRQWYYRAAQELKQRTDPATWEDWFASWFERR